MYGALLFALGVVAFAKYGVYDPVYTAMNRRKGGETGLEPGNQTVEEAENMKPDFFPQLYGVEGAEYEIKNAVGITNRSLLTDDEKIGVQGSFQNYGAYHNTPSIEPMAEGTLDPRKIHWEKLKKENPKQTRLNFEPYNGQAIVIEARNRHTSAINPAADRINWHP